MAKTKNYNNNISFILLKNIFIYLFYSLQYRIFDFNGNVDYYVRCLLFFFVLNFNTKHFSLLLLFVDIFWHFLFVLFHFLVWCNKTNMWCSPQKKQRLSFYVFLPKMSHLNEWKVTIVFCGLTNKCTLEIYDYTLKNLFQFLLSWWQMSLEGDRFTQRKY